MIPYLFAAFVLIFFCLKGNIPGEYGLSYDDGQRAAELKQLSGQLREKMVMSDAVPSFENTVIWTYGGENTCYSEYYALPSGYGINLVYEDVVLSAPKTLKSRYIGVSPGSLLEEKLVSSDAVYLAGDSKLNFYGMY